MTDAARVPVAVIGPGRAFSFVDPRALWQFRELALVLAGRDVKLRYAQSALGAAWALLQPLASAAVFAVIFGRFAHLPSGGVAYAPFVLAGLIPWSFLVTAVSSAATSAISSQALISKVYFPRFIIPLAAVLASVVDLLVALPVLIGAIVLFDVPFTAQLLFAPVAGALLLVVALGVGTLLCALTVAYRDFRYVIPFGLQLWLYATPIVYPESIVPERWRPLLALNPAAGVAHLFRVAFLGAPLDAAVALTSTASALVILVAGVVAFARVERRIADIL